jgi:outer membrane protein assembly factor BamB
VIVSDRVCFEWERRLQCVELTTGETIWERDDVAADCDLFGDDELLFATPPGSTTAQVFSLLDGREVGQRTVPELRDRVYIAGRRIVTWDSTAERSRITCRDVWANEKKWEQEIAGKTVAAVTPAAELFVLTTAGRLSTIDLRSGALRTKVELEPLEDVEGLFVLVGPQRYYLFANRPVKDDPVGIARQVQLGQRFVNGRVTALARETGQKLWSTDVANQTLRLDLPTGLPVLPLVRTFQVFVMQPQGGFSSSSQKTHWSALDAGSGKVLFDETYNEGEWYIELNAAPQDQRLTVRGRVVGLQFAWPK